MVELVLKTIVLVLLAIGIIRRAAAFAFPERAKKMILGFQKALDRRREVVAEVLCAFSLVMFYLVFTQASVLTVVASAIAGIFLVDGLLVWFGAYRDWFNILKKMPVQQIRVMELVIVVILAVLFWAIWTAP